MEKILIRRDGGAEAKFLKAVDDTVKKGNELIELFNSTQDFKRIDTLEEAVGLISDPLEYYDQVLIDNISHDKRLQVNMNSLAELYNIPRKEFLMGIGIPEDQVAKCQTCGGGPEKVLPKLKTLSLRQYTEYSQFLLFKNGDFVINTQAVEDHSESFNIYASAPGQIEVYNHYKSLTETLNKAIEFHKLGPVKIEQLANMFGFQILGNKLLINELTLAETIKYIK